jgi:hypothetical protein
VKLGDVEITHPAALNNQIKRSFCIIEHLVDGVKERVTLRQS